MKKILWNEDWEYTSQQKEDWKKISLPHDAMLHENRSENSRGGLNIGWFECYDYIYRKDFKIQEEYKDKKLILEFEGVYRNAKVVLNGKEIATHSYGYTGFYIDITPFVKYGENNQLKVYVHNADQPNSRWYSGTGIYRPVWLYVLEKEHIVLNGIKIKTISSIPATINVQVTTSQKENVKVEIMDKDICVCTVEKQSGEEIELTISNAKLWSVENPYLYICKVTCNQDAQEEKFGIRTIQCDRENGLCINGERVILRGACIHHDNGLLGACCYSEAEERKIKLLKECGYNAIRSAHNPCSKALLEACDKLGVLVMDEYVDMWYIHKTRYDYAMETEKNYQQDLLDMIEKDYNHPSVVLYSIGNEVSETAQKRGIKFCETMVKYCHQLDSTRPVTCGVNIFFNFLSSLGFGVYSDKKAEEAPKKEVGSAFFNRLAGMFGDKTMKFGASLHGSDIKTRDAFATMDVAGYNYGIYRYKKDLKKYPKRIILGSETFCSDTYSFYQLAKKEKGLIGDFVWAGMDYLGEVGIGAWEYLKYAPSFDNGVGWMTAGSGRLDITGKGSGEAAYTKVVYGKEKIALAVVPVDCAGEEHSPSAWKMTNAKESWSWRGYEGKRTKVEVYADAYAVELYLNGKKVGKKKTKKVRAYFKLKYENGELNAKSFTKDGKIIAEKTLSTGEEQTILSINAEKEKVKKGELCYIRFSYTDKNGIVKPYLKGDIKISLQGGKLLGFGNGCSYNKRGYLTNISDVYYGETLAIIQVQEEKAVLSAESKYGEGKITILGE